MPGPTELAPWTEIPPEDTDAESPMTAALISAIAQNNDHVYSWIGGSYTPAEDHDHRGVNSKHVFWPGYNWINGPTFYGQAWTEKGLTLRSFGGYAGSNEGSLISRGILRYEQNYQLIGEGSHFVCSLMAKTDASLTAGKMLFGVTSDDTSFLPGCMFSVDFPRITTSWQRFWGSCWVEVEEADVPIRFSVVFDDGFSSAVEVSAFNMTPGKVLQFFQLDHMGTGSDDTPDARESDHQFWVSAPYNVPIFDEAITMTNAVRLYPT